MISPSKTKDRPNTIIYSENGEVYQKAQLLIHSLQSCHYHVRASTEQSAKDYCITH